MNFLKNIHPGVFIALACVLWALDELVRFPTTLTISFEAIVFVESILGLLIITPWVLWKHGPRKVFKISLKDYSLALFLGAGAMGIAGICYTRSMHYITPEFFSLFQIIQPLFVVLLAYYFLKETPGKQYIPMALWVLGSGVVIFIPSFQLGIVGEEISTHPVEIFMALTSMVMWGVATVAGKSLLKRHAVSVVVFWRWFFSGIFMGAVVLIRGIDVPFTSFFDQQIIFKFAFISVFAGIFAMIIYYHGLRKMEAGLTSFVELLYPALGIILSSLYFYQRVEFIQVLGFVSFLFAIFILLKIYSGKVQRE